MNTSAAIVGSFFCACAVITWRDIKTPDKAWPLPAPPPYRYVGAGVAYGLLGLVGAFFSDRLAAVLAIGLLVGLTFQTAQSQTGGISGLVQGVKKASGSAGTIAGSVGQGVGGSALGSPISGTSQT